MRQPIVNQFSENSNYTHDQSCHMMSPLLWPGCLKMSQPSSLCHDSWLWGHLTTRLVACWLHIWLLHRLIHSQQKRESERREVKSALPMTLITSSVVTWWLNRVDGNAELKGSVFMWILFPPFIPSFYEAATCFQESFVSPSPSKGKAMRCKNVVQPLFHWFSLSLLPQKLPNNQPLAPFIKMSIMSPGFFCSPCLDVVKPRRLKVKTRRLYGYNSPRPWSSQSSRCYSLLHKTTTHKKRVDKGK